MTSFIATKFNKILTTIPYSLLQETNAMQHIVLLGIGTITAIIAGSLVLYLRRLKNKIKRFTLERDKIAKYLRDDI